MLALLATACSLPERQERVAVAPFDVVMALVPRATPNRIVVLISANSGVDSRLVALGRGLARQGALAVLVDRRLHRDRLEATSAAEVDLAANYAEIRDALKRALRVDSALPVTLVGIDAGAAEAWAALAQSEPGTFAGAIGVRFCPTLSLPKPAAIRGALAIGEARTPQAQRLLPAPLSKAPFIAMVGAAPADCAPGETAAFIAATSSASLLSVDGLDAGLDGQERWRDELDQALAQIAETTR